MTSHSIFQMILFLLLQSCHTSSTTGETSSTVTQMTTSVALPKKRSLPSSASANASHTGTDMTEPILHQSTSMDMNTSQHSKNLFFDGQMYQNKTMTFFLNTLTHEVLMGLMVVLMLIIILLMMVILCTLYSKQRQSFEYSNNDFMYNNHEEIYYGSKKFG